MDMQEYWNNQFMKALELEGITDPLFFDFIVGKVKRYNIGVDEFGWACFPVLDDAEVIRDIRIVVPTIKDTKSLLINLHEYTHAYELYEELGTVYIERIDEREEKAKNAEKRYLLTINNK